MGHVNELPLKQALAESRRGFLWIGAFGLFVNLLVLTSPIYMMQVFDRVLTSGRTETLVMLTLVAGIAVATMALLDTARSMLLQRIGHWIEQRTAPQVVTSSIEVAIRSGVVIQTRSDSYRF